ncbi:hypothetical protein CBL_11586 [Carabus blaptoides fortunei]
MDGTRLTFHMSDAQVDVDPMKKEIVEYCVADVVILRRACITFRQSFIQNCGVCPFTEADHFRANRDQPILNKPQETLNSRFNRTLVKTAKLRTLGLRVAYHGIS